MKNSKNMVPVPEVNFFNLGTGTKINQFTKAFTLVELIVVITILSILATVGFVSFSGYLAGTRDVNRKAQLKSMSDALELYRTRKDLPIPDDKIDVKARADLIAYQGDIGKNVLETIEYTESGLDPKYKEYFSYYLSKNKKYYQLMAFLEEPSDDIVAGTNAMDYSDKYPFVKGKKLGVLTDINNNPIQKVLNGSVDTKTATGYIAYVDNGKKLVGREIGGLKEIIKLGGIEQNLVAWYDFETIDGTGFLDLSGNNYTGEIIGNFAKIHTGSIGPVGKAMKFDGANITDYIILPNKILDGKKDYSISIWMKFYDLTENYGFSVLTNETDNEVLLGGFNSTRGICSSLKYPFIVCDKKSYKMNKWTHMFFSKNSSEIILYIDGIKSNTQNNNALSNLILNPKGITIGQDQDGSVAYGGFSASQAIKGEIDDLRIYEGTMSEGRIEKIYKLGR